MAVGAILAFGNKSPLARTVGSSCASFLLLATSFSGVQELSRRVFCVDAPLNSGLGGAATGALLFASHGALPQRGAALCGILGFAGHVALTTGLEHGDAALRKVLIGLELLDPSARPEPPPGGHRDEEAS